MVDIRNAELELKPNWWPSPQDYNEAIQELRINAQDPELQRGLVHCNALGLPRPLSGTFASVYKIHAAGTDWAVRCFLKDLSDQEERYAHISRFVQNDALDYTVTFDFLKTGIRLHGRWFPILKMDWVDGLNLDLYIDQHLGTSKIPLLATSFKKMCEELQKAGIAHGDMQHGNIIVHGDELRLVDYDGMFVPAMAGMLSNEIGHRNYQHPGREARHFDANLDNFSAWVIYASLRCISIDPDLYRHLGGGDECLLFRRDDFLEPEHSYAFGLLEEHGSEEIRGLAKFLRWQLKRSPDEVPPLLDEVPPIPQLPSLVINTDEASASLLSDQKMDGGPLPDWISPDEVNSTKARTLRQPRAVPPRVMPSNSTKKNLPATIEPELLQPLPRYVRFDPNRGRSDPNVIRNFIVLNPLTWVMAAPLFVPGVQGLAIFCLCSLILLSIWIWYQPNRHRHLARFGHAITTSNFGTRTESNTEVGDIYFAELEFEPPGKLPVTCEKRLTVDEFNWLNGNFGTASTKGSGKQSVTVLFDPENPDNNLLYMSSLYKAVKLTIPATVEEELKTQTPRAIEYEWQTGRIDPKIIQAVILLSPTCWGVLYGGLGAACCLCLTLFFEWLLWKNHLRERDLISEGVPVNARVTNAILGDNFALDQSGAFIEYDFKTYDGRTIHGTCAIKRSEYALFATETTYRKIRGERFVTVLYDANSPEEKHIVYALSQYRAKS